MGRLHPAGIIAIVTALSAGCVILPVPPSGHTGAYKTIEDETVRFIEIGRTTREDLLLRLGAPDSVQERTFVYGTEKRGWSVLFVCCFIPTPFGVSAPPGPAGSVESKTYRPLIVEFDERSVVTAWRWGEPERRTTGEGDRPGGPPPALKVTIRPATLVDVETKLFGESGLVRGEQRFEAEFERMELTGPDAWRLRTFIQEAMACPVGSEVTFNGTIDGTKFEAKMRKDSKRHTRVKFEGLTFQNDRQMTEFVEPFTVEQGPDEFTLGGFVAGRRVTFTSP